MIPGRRTFILGTALVATAPVLAKALSLLSTVRSHTSLLPESLSPQSPASETDVSCLAFKIDGWDRCGDIATDDAAGDQVWISINRSWRAAWR